MSGGVVIDIATTLSALQRQADNICETIAKLRAVAECAKALVEGAHDLGAHVVVLESHLTALETVLEEAGYGMTEEEFERRFREGMRELEPLGAGPLEPEVPR